MFLPCLTNPPSLFQPFLIVFKMKSISQTPPTYFSGFILNPMLAASLPTLQPHWPLDHLQTHSALGSLPLYSLFLECSCSTSSHGWLLIHQASLPLLFHRDTIPISLSLPITLSFLFSSLFTFRNRFLFLLIY